MGGALVDEKRINNDYNENEETPVIKRTVTVACSPHENVGLTASFEHHQISPKPDYDNPVGQVSEELVALYKKGWVDAEKWLHEEDLRERELAGEWCSRYSAPKE